MTDIPAGEVRDKGPLLLLSQRFEAWIAAADVCLALTTYQAGRLFFVGRRDEGGVRAHERIARGAMMIRRGKYLGELVGDPPEGEVISSDARPAVVGSIADLGQVFEHEGPLPHPLQDQPQ